jgi:hypothetical protein
VEDPRLPLLPLSRSPLSCACTDSRTCPTSQWNEPAVDTRSRRRSSGPSVTSHVEEVMGTFPFDSFYSIGLYLILEHHIYSYQEHLRATMHYTHHPKGKEDLIQILIGI